MQNYRVDIEGEGGFELYVVSAEGPISAIEAGLRRYEAEHINSNARRCRVYTLDGELLLDKRLADQ